MLDIVTSMVFAEVLIALKCITTFLLWRAYRQLHGLAEVSIGCLALVSAFALMGVRTPHVITISNVLLTFALGIVVEGMVVLIGKPPRRWLVYALTAFTAVFWEIIQMVDPENVPIRVVVATIMYIGIYGRLTWEAFRNDHPLGAARSLLIVILLIHMAVLLGRMVVSVLHPDPNFVFSQAFLPWFLLETTTVMVLIFFSIMIIVGTRLNEDLASRVQGMAAERRMHGQLKQFLSMLGHELRTPMAVIDRSAEMSQILLKPQQDDVGQRLGVIRATVRRMRQLTDNLLMAERAELGVASGELVDLTVIVRQLIRILAQKYETERIEADLPDTGAIVAGDGEMISTVIGNLLDNALKFSPENQPVRVSVEVGDSIRIIVRDSGIGFPPQQMAQIGQRFFRAANAAHIPGTGLGLSIAKTVIEAYRGQLEFTNGHEGGAVVTIILPRAKA